MSAKIKFTTSKKIKKIQFKKKWITDLTVKYKTTKHKTYSI